MKSIKFILLVLVIISSTKIYSGNNSFLFRPTGSNFFIYGKGTGHFIIHQSRLSQWNINRTISKLASSKRINNAADDPAGMAVAEKIAALIKGLQQKSMNAENMRNFHYYVESAIKQNQEILKRIRELILRSSSGILGPEDRGYNQSEINQLLRQIDMNARFSQFNTMAVIPNLTTDKLGLKDVNVVRNLYGSMKHVDNALKMLQKRRIIQGIRSNILTFRIKGMSYNFLNLQRAESGIRDLDMARGISRLMKNKVLLKSQYGIIIKSK